MSDKLPEAIRSLQRAKESAERRLVEIDTERRDLKASLKSLEAALKALGSRRSTAPSAIAAPTTADVIDIVMELLMHDGGLSMEQLAKAVGEQLAERGKNRMGLRLRLEQALKDKRIAKNMGGYELRANIVGNQAKQQDELNQPEK